MSNEPTPGDAHDPDRSDISADAKDIFCPHCDYNLRGLTERRCPECGRGFDPSMLAGEPAICAQLIERQPQPTLTSLLSTTYAGFQPREFWQAMEWIEPPRVGMILWYWCIGALLCLITVCECLLTASSLKVAPPLPGLPAIQVLAETLAVLPARLWLSMIVPLGWPWLTFALLWGLRSFMKRPHVETVRLLRCALYCFDTPVWMGIVFFPLLTVLQISHGYSVAGSLIFAFPIGWFVGTLLGCWRLRIALKQHLRVSRPLLVLLLSQSAVLVLVALLSITSYLLLF